MLGWKTTAALLLAITAVLGAALPAAGQVRSTPSAAPSAAGDPAAQACIVAAVGDSLTDARSHGGKFLDVLRKRFPGSRFDNYGKGGEMVNQMRRRFGRDVLGQTPGGQVEKPKYTHVIIFGGVNDLYSDLTAGRTPAKIERDLTTMYEMAHDNGIKVVAMTVAPWGGFKRYYNASRGAATRTLNDWIRAQKRTGKADSVIDAYSLLSCGDRERLCPRYVAPFRDGLHFNEEAHGKLGEALAAGPFAGCP